MREQIDIPQPIPITFLPAPAGIQKQ